MIPILKLSKNNLAKTNGLMLVNSMREMGFVYINVEDFGIDQTVVSSANTSFKNYIINTSLIEKNKYASQFSGRGYSKFIQRGGDLDFIQSFNIGNFKNIGNSSRNDYFNLVNFPHDLREKVNKSLTNKLPPSLEIKPIQSYYEACTHITNELLILIEIGLDIPPQTLTLKHSKNDHTLEFKHYPKPSSKLLNQNQERFGEHKDYSTITILSQDSNEGGLQIYNNNIQKWIDAPHIDNNLLINTGDLMKALTNSELPSTLHRVVVKENASERNSIVFFAQPNWETKISQEELVGDFMPLF